MSRNEALSRAKFILSSLRIGQDLKDAAYEIREYLIDLVQSGDLDEVDFYRITSLLTPQSRSPLWEKYFIKKYQCKKVGKDENRGDIEKDGKFYEYKASGFNQDKGLNIVQIRLWHDCGYIIQSISDQGAITFILTHDEMKAETKLLSAQSAHGTKNVTSENKFNELRMTVKRETEDWERWIDKYMISDFRP